MNPYSFEAGQSANVLFPSSLHFPRSKNISLTRRNLDEELTLSSHDQYRNSRTGNQRRAVSQPDHDVFEGLPVRHWRKKPISLNTSTEKPDAETTNVLPSGYHELSMPKDATQLSETCYQLLRAARQGLMRNDTTDGRNEGRSHRSSQNGSIDDQSGLLTKKWTLVPRENEGPEPEFLAKRRKGMSSLYGVATLPTVTSTTMRKTKIRKLDTDGKNLVWEVLVPDGQTIDGELAEDETSPTEVPLPGTVVEGLGIVNADGVVVAGEQASITQSRRKPPPPKRKSKGRPNKDRKKVAFATGGNEQNGLGEMNDAATPATVDGDDVNGSQIMDGENAQGEDSVMQDMGEDGEDGVEGGSEPDDREVPDKSMEEAVTMAEIVRERLMDVDSDVNIPSPNPPTYQVPDVPIRPDSTVDLSLPTIKIIDAQKTAVDPLPNEPSNVPVQLEQRDSVDINAFHEPEDLFEAAQGMQSLNDASASIKDFDDGATSNGAQLPLGMSTDANAQPMHIDAVSNVGALDPPEATELQPHQESFSPPQPASATTNPLPQVPVSSYSERPQGSVDQPPQERPENNGSNIPSSIEVPPTSDPSTSQARLQSFPEADDLNLSELVQAERPLEPPETEKFGDTGTPIIEMSTLEPNEHRQEGFEVPYPASPRTLPTLLQQQHTPNAPTPSPPTPMATSFEQRHRFVDSPKAPTMSPPTPARDLSVSPSLPGLSVPPLPQPSTLDLNSTNNESQPSIPHIPGIGSRAFSPPEDTVEVEAAPHVPQPHFNAEIPHAHNPIDGLAPPETLRKESKAAEDEPIRFEDGEEDLLSNFEKSLAPKNTE